LEAPVLVQARASAIAMPKLARCIVFNMAKWDNPGGMPSPLC
jgi:hypothetical protein